MKKFLLYCTAIVMIAFCFSFTIEKTVDAGLIGLENSRYQDWDNILSGNINAEVLVLGSSRGMTGYNSEIIEKFLNKKTHNLSVNAGSYGLQRDKYTIYLKYNKAPSIIIQNIDLVNFQESKRVPDHLFLLPFTSHEDIRDMLLKYDDEISMQKFFPNTKYMYSLRFMKNGFNSFSNGGMGYEFHVKGFSGATATYVEDTHNIEGYKKSGSETFDYSNLENGVAQSIKFYQQQAQNGIKIILCWAPEYEDRRMYTKNISDPIRRRFEELAQKEKHIYFLDNLNDALGNEKENFYDSFHLNATGAARYSEKIGQELNTIIDAI